LRHGERRAIYATRFSDDFLQHHIFNPRLADHPGVSQRTVVATTGLEADGLGTAIMVLGPERGSTCCHYFQGGSLPV